MSERIRSWAAIAALLCGGTALSAFLSVALGNRFFGHVHYIYNWGTLVFPVLLLLLAIPMWRQRRMRAFAACAVLAVAAFGTRLYATHIEPQRLQIREERIAVKGLTAPIRILHLSDLQTAAMGSYEDVVFEKIAALDADLLIWTGDFIQPVSPATHSSELPKLVTKLNALHPKYGMFGVIGDVDGTLTPTFRQPDFPIRFLDAESVVLETPGKIIRLHGLGLRASRYPDFTRLALESLIAEDIPEDFSILFGHAPDFVIEAEKHPIDLCLAGHTHGGQIRVPFYGPLITMTSVSRRLAWGFHQVGSTRLNVSSGIGAEHADGLPSIRMFCPPELCVITLEPLE